jgi:hypothetical protein
MSTRRTRLLDRQMEFKLPTEMDDVITEVANERMISRSAFCRQAVAEKLEREGLMPPMPHMRLVADKG